MRHLQVCACALFLSAAGQVAAQSRPALGNPIDQLPKIQVPDRPAVEVRLPQSPPASITSGQLLTPKKFIVQGVQSLPFDQVSKVFTPMTGRQTSVDEIVKAAAQITRMYKDAGFAMSFCFIPRQDFADGVVRVEVVEGYVDSIVISGDPGYSENRIRAIAESARNDKPLRTQTFNKMASILARLPGVKVSATVDPPQATDGKSVMKLVVARKAATVSTALDTYRPGARLILTATLNSLTPLGDQLSVSALASHHIDGEEFYSLQDSIPIGVNGVLVQGNVYRYGEKTAVPFGPASLTDTQSVSKASILLSRPLLIEQDMSVIADSGLEISRDRDDLAVGGLRSREEVNLRVLRMGLSLNYVSPTHHGTASASIFEGLSALGASVSPADYPVDPRFTRAIFAGLDRVSLPAGFEVTPSFRAQYSADRLASSEQIAFGGAQFGEGYPISDIVGSSGAGVSLEGGRTWHLNGPIVTVIEPYLVVDTARAWSRSPAATTARIASAAMGTRFSDAHRFTIDINVARPIGTLPVDSDSRALRLNVNFAIKSD